MIEKCRDLNGWFLFLLEWLNTPIQQCLPRFCASPEDFVLRLSNSGVFQYFPLSSPSVFLINVGIAKSQQSPLIFPFLIGEEVCFIFQHQKLFLFPVANIICEYARVHDMSKFPDIPIFQFFEISTASTDLRIIPNT